jgi:hypothetical protein
LLRVQDFFANVESVKMPIAFTNECDRLREVVNRRFGEHHFAEEDVVFDPKLGRFVVDEEDDEAPVLVPPEECGESF